MSNNGKTGYAPGDLIVKITPKSTEKVKMSFSKNHPNVKITKFCIESVDNILEKVKVLEIKNLYENTYLIRMSPDTNLEQVKKQMIENSFVEDVDFNYISFSSNFSS